jgi:hypothetical protein
MSRAAAASARLATALLGSRLTALLKSKRAWRNQSTYPLVTDTRIDVAARSPADQCAYEASSVVSRHGLILASVDAGSAFATAVS